MRHVVGPKADQEVEEGHSGQCHGSPALLRPYLGSGEHDMHKAPVAEDGDQRGDEEEGEIQLLLCRKQYDQFSWVKLS